MTVADLTHVAVDPVTGQGSLNSLRARRFMELTLELKALKAREEELTSERAAIERAMLEEIEMTGVKPGGVVMPDGTEYTLFTRAEVRANALDPEGVVAWFQANGLGAKVRVLPQTLAAVVKEYKTPEDVPESLRALISIFEQFNIRSRVKK